MELSDLELISDDQLPDIITHSENCVSSSTFAPAPLPGLALQRVCFSDESDLMALLLSQGSLAAFVQP